MLFVLPKPLGSFPVSTQFERLSFYLEGGFFGYDNMSKYNKKLLLC